MKLIFACLFIGLSLAVVQANETYYPVEFRSPTGHFKEPPFSELYKEYAVAFLNDYHKGKSKDHYVNYVPTGKECVNFFSSFRINGYQLGTRLEQFVLLDACLGYLYESKFHEADMENDAEVKKNLPLLQQDENLKELYSTEISKKFTKDQKRCIVDMLHHAIQGASQFKNILCNSDIIQFLVQFASCQEPIIPKEQRETDPYLKMIYQMVSDRAKTCFKNEIQSMNEASTKEYSNNPFPKPILNIFQSIKAIINKKLKLAMKRDWPLSVAIIFSLIQRNTKEYNVRNLHGIIKGVLEDKGHFRETFLQTLTNFTNKYYEKTKKSELLRNDNSGGKLYQEMVDHICRFFRSSDDKDFYDYAGSFVRMNRMIQYKEVLGVDTEEFLHSVLEQSYNSGPIYLCVSYCNLLTFTEAAYSTTTAPSKKFVVSFKQDLTEMVKWPVLKYF